MFIIIIGRSTNEMSTTNDGSHRRSVRIAVFALVVALLTPLMAFNVEAEIPHENYDLVGSDLEMVVAMLNASIRASEDTLRSLYEKDMSSAETHLERATAVVGPAEAILGEIDDIAASYEQLSFLIPPFSGLHEEMRAFSDLEGRMLSIHDDIVAIAMEVNLSDADAVEAIDSIRQMNAVLSAMNETIDVMRVHAEEIDVLTVGERRPFVPNELVELIERLRDLTVQMYEEIIELIEDGIPWQDDRSLLLLWVADADLYLGEALSGGGYLLKNGTFAADVAVAVSVDESLIAVPDTNEEGAFSFSFVIPLNTSWLGQHDVTAAATVSGELVESGTIEILVSLVPTEIVLVPSNCTVSPNEELTIEAMLTRDRGLPLPGAECSLSVDGAALAFSTDDDGRGEWTWLGADLGMTTHEFAATYPGVLPYAPCESDIVSVTVDVPTQVEINLFSDRLRKGYQLVGDGTLAANGSTPLSGQSIVLLVDGFIVANVSTDATGKFAFSIDTADYEEGTHVFTAQFIDHDPYWRSSDDREKFVIISLRYTDYPFFPWIPGWDIGGGLQEQIPYLFFGEYAYFTWLFVLLVVGMVIKALQVRSRRILAAAASESVRGDGGPPTPAPRAGTPGPLDRMPDWLVGPNEKIIWHYHSLLAFLRARGQMGITDDMTHWEIAGLLGSLGYPQADAGRVALLYEMAQYSGRESSEEDVAQMDSSSSSLRLSGGVRPAL